MHCLEVHRSLVAGSVVSAAILALALGSAAAIAAPVSAASTTEFQVPVTFLSACGVGFRCYLPTLAAVTPSATTNAPGAVSFAATPPTTISITWLDCIDVTVHWRNLTTGATGATEIRRVPPDYSRPTAPGEWCRYNPTTVVTGSGTVAATADVAAAASRTGDHRPISSGVGLFQVP
ncbi:hypothetical protein SAMN04490239_0740 [Rhodococcus koreensis]|uniref:Secreted protein n=1 Tax=Rhodococcus koreensis TaxID=99653 RepID=A0A1H4IJJ1_9NOCA|nr:hypothetical protein SAMN04490239_0740 [Rhodococcus koreensis]